MLSRATRIALRANSTSSKFNVPVFLPDCEKQYGVKAPENYVPPQYRDPYEKYDDQQNRVNFGEEIHPYHDYMDMWSPDHIQPVSDSTAFKHFGIFFGALSLFGYSIYALDIWPEKPAMPRSYPYGGLFRDLGGKEGEEELFQARVDKGVN